jgi:hypothetical protein
MHKVTGRTFSFCAIVSICVLAGPLVGTSLAADQTGTNSTSAPTGSSSTPAPVGSSSTPGQVGTTAAAVVVSPSSPNGWTFVNDVTNAKETGTFVTGPATPPLGTGSVQLATPTAADAHIIATQAYGGTTLSSITALTYSTYQAGPPSPLAIALEFDIRYRTADPGYGGRLVYEPYQNGTVTVGSGWHQWDAINAGLALWWASKQTGPNGTGGLCPQSAPCTWAAVKLAFPQATILPGGNLLLKAGSNWAGFTGDADALIVGVSGSSTTYDFGPDVVVIPPGNGGGGGTPAGAGAATFALGATSAVTPGGGGPPTLTLGATNPATPQIPTQVQGKQVTRTPKSHHQTKSPSNSGGSSWLWWLLAIIVIGFVAFIWILFGRSRSAGV